MKQDAHWTVSGTAVITVNADRRRGNVCLVTIGEEVGKSKGMQSYFVGISRSRAISKSFRSFTRKAMSLSSAIDKLPSSLQKLATLSSVDVQASGASDNDKAQVQEWISKVAEGSIVKSYKVRDTFTRYYLNNITFIHYRT